MSLVSNQTKAKKKSKKGCWTCKARKIGCDKEIPHCSNCIRTNRHCEGYGVKLHWPEAGDGRRPVNPWDVDVYKPSLISAARESYHFLNSTYADLMVAMDSDQRYPHYKPTVSPPKSLKYGYETTLNSQEGLLLSYYTEVLSRMITTIDDSLNGFRTILLPSALAEDELSSHSLRYAILALSAFHLWGHEAAAKYKILAIRLLGQSFRAGKGGLRGKFATCMMLCVCDVFDAADGSWYMHMNAAKTIRGFSAKNASCMIGKETISGVFSVVGNQFLNTWLLYHDVLADFSSGKRRKGKQKSMSFTLPDNTYQDTIIIGSLGCSLEVLQCISCINDLVTTTDTKAEVQAFAARLAGRLESLQQVSAVVKDNLLSKVEETRIQDTAEFYRLGALIYLHSSMSVNSKSDTIQRLVRRSIEILENESYGVCTSPFPLFMVACEVISEDQRSKILDILDKMQSERRIGNVVIMRDIIEKVWKQQDLVGANGIDGKGIDWRDLIDTSNRLPSFI